MKITFQVEKVLRYNKVEVELNEEQIETINKLCEIHNITFEVAFRRYADKKGIIWEIMWDRDEDDSEYNVWDVEVIEK